jgi:hypothetical protein
VTAVRKVHFYQAVTLEGHPYRAFPGGDVVRQLRRLAQNEATELQISGGRSLMTSVPARVRERQGEHLVLYMVSSEDLPVLYDRSRREILSLDQVLQGADIAEPTYFAFLPDGVLGFVFNLRGPKPGKLADYLTAQIAGLEVDFVPVARIDVLRAIEEAGEVRQMTLKLPVSRVAQLGDVPSLAALGRAADGLQGVADIEVIFRARTDVDRRSFARSVREIIPRLLRQQEALNKAKIALGRDDDYAGDRPLDLLEDTIVVSQEIDTIPGRRRQLDPREAHDAIETAYRLVQGELRRSMNGG